MKRSKPLRVNKPLRRLKRLSTRSKTNSYRKRVRDFEFMRWVKRQPCFVRVLPPLAGDLGTPCCGRVEADHMGARGFGQKADDKTCVPMCHRHHSERTTHRGTFWPLTQPELRAWRARAIEHTQAEWERR